MYGSGENNTSCNVFQVFDMVIGFSPAVASFLGVVAVSEDRFLAIQFLLRYQEIVTLNFVVTVVISIWSLSIA